MPLRFVILEHDQRAAESPPGVLPLHWDLMIEQTPGGKLATWRLASNPLTTRAPIAATRIGEHRAEYLEYEGPLSGGRGVVRRLDAGTAQMEQRGADIGLELLGAACRGKFEIRTNGDSQIFQQISRD